jgi:flagellin
MGAYLYTNVASLSAQRNLQTSQDMLKTSTERLSSGKRVNSAKDDSAGAGIAKRFLGNVQGIRQGVRNAQDGAAMADAGEAVLEQMAQMTLRVRELGVQAQNGTYSQADRDNITSEVTALKAGIDGLALNAKYNGQSLLDASFSSVIQYSDVSTGNLTVSQGTSFTNVTLTGPSSSANAVTTVSDADTLLTSIASARSSFAKQSTTLGYVAAAQSALAEAVDSARSRIEDTDYAAETAQMTRNQILQQAATAALAQANAMPNTILSLIK